MSRLLHHLLETPPAAAPCPSVAAFRVRSAALLAGFPHTVDRAAVAGFHADRLGYAFAGGYQAALERLLPDLGPLRASFCATETGGAHPSAVATQLAFRPGGATLTGHKAFATLATEAEVLLVVASEGRRADGRNRLRLVHVPADAPGLTIRPLDPLPFAPEIPHAAVDLAAVPVAAAAIREGDGYTRYLKPFRTIEDVHVMAAVAGHLVATARAHGWPEDFVESLLAVLLALRALGDEDPLDPAVHIALAGALADLQRAVALADPWWDSAPAPLRDRWRRDRPLLDVAGTARRKRRDAAWRPRDPHPG